MSDDDLSTGDPNLRLDLWAPVLFALHVTVALAFVPLYPLHVFDTDLLAYFVFFRDWATGTGALHGLDYFFQPKPLLVFTLGPLGNVHTAVACTSVATGLLGAAVYLVGRDSFGRTVGILWSLALLLDPSRTFLTLKSSADLYLTALVFVSIWLLIAGRFTLAAACVLLAALIKPVALPCALQFLLVPAPIHRRLAYAALPALALPATLLGNHLLLGSALDPGQYLAQFAALRDTTGISPGEVIHFALWTQLVDTRFVSTAPLGALGLLMWLAADRTRLTHPLFLLPLLVLGGYLALSVATPYMPFFRFFWVLEVWFLGYLMFAIVSIGRLVGGAGSRLAAAATALMLLFLVDDSLTQYARYRDHYALPMERNMEFVQAAADTLARERRGGEVVLAPLAFQSYLMWTAPPGTPDTVVLSAEAAARHGLKSPPPWILDVPAGYVSDPARALVDGLEATATYEPRLANGPAALLRLTPP
ncbi:hypothetical protein L6Q96_15620 [Candidatus Binatia bacterium]|nr:hypothetical protein [Candidatus Binatia bacterium]